MKGAVSRSAKRVHQMLCRINAIDLQRWLALRRLGVHVVNAEETLVELRNGMSICLETSQYISQKILRYGCFDPVVAETIVRLSEPGLLHVDVGANVGYTAILMAGRAGREGLVLAYEPAPRTFGRLEANAERANLVIGKNVLIPSRVAIGSRNGTAMLEVPQGIECCDGLPSIQQESVAGVGLGSLEVDIRRLGDLLTQAGEIVILKIDVEGGECGVLEGAYKLLAARRVRHVVYEEHEAFPGAASSFLLKLGFEIRRLDPSGVLGLSGVALSDPMTPRYAVPPGFEPDVNYVASTMLSEVSKRMRSPLWRCA